MGNIKIFFAVLVAVAAITAIKCEYLIGLGRADITGPSVEIGFVS